MVGSYFNSKDIRIFSEWSGAEIPATLTYDMPSTDAVLLVHGYASDRNCQSNIFLSSELPKRNIATLAIDLSGHGESKLDISNQGIVSFVYDIISAAEYLRDNGYGTVGIFANSISALAAIEAVRINEERGYGVNITRLGLKSPIVDMRQMIIRKCSEQFIDEWHNKGIATYKPGDGREILLPYSFYEEATYYLPKEFCLNSKVFIAYGSKDMLVSDEEIAYLTSQLRAETYKCDADHGLTLEGNGAMHRFVEFFSGK